MEPQFDDELLQLKNALRQETFRFIIIGHNRYSIYQDIAQWLHTTFPERHFLELRLTGKDYRQINDELVAFKKGIMLIPDFGWLFQRGNEPICVAFNQRRDAFARLDIALLCFIEPSEFIVVPRKVPDWWSLRSLELDFHRETPDAAGDFLIAEFETSSSLGGQTKEEKEAEIQRLLKQIEATESDNKVLLYTLYAQVAILLFELSQFRESLKYLELSLNICKQIDNKVGEGQILNSIGSVYKSKGEYTVALKYFEHSLKIRRQLVDKIGEGTNLNNIGVIYQAQGEHIVALEYFEHSLKIRQQMHDKEGESITLNNIGLNYQAQGEYSVALEYFEHSLKILHQLGNKKRAGPILSNIGRIYQSKGEYTKALKFFEKILVNARQTGDRAEEAQYLNNIGSICQNQGEPIKALNYYEQSLEIASQIGDKQGMALIMNNLGSIYMNEYQEIRKALFYLLKSHEILQQVGSSQIKVIGNTPNSIQKQIGEERFNQIVQSVQNNPPV